jgi:hypothetical protein
MMMYVMEVVVVLEEKEKKGWFLSRFAVLSVWTVGVWNLLVTSIIVDRVRSPT